MRPSAMRTSSSAHPRYVSALSHWWYPCGMSKLFLAMRSLLHGWEWNSSSCVT